MLKYKILTFLWISQKNVIGFSVIIRFNLKIFRRIKKRLIGNFKGNNKIIQSEGIYWILIDETHGMFNRRIWCNLGSDGINAEAFVSSGN